MGSAVASSMSVASSAPVASTPTRVTGSAPPSGDSGGATARVTIQVAMRTRLPMAPARYTFGPARNRRSHPRISWNTDAARKKTP